MKRFILFWALLVLFAAPASAVDTNVYPFVIVDADCTDANDVPAAYTPSSPHSFVRKNVITPSALIQTSGSPDGFCDNDSRILVGAAITDTTFGPFSNGGIDGLYIMVETTSVTGATPSWRTFIAAFRTQDATLLGIEELDTESAASGLFDYTVGSSPGTPSEINDGTFDMQLPNTWYFKLDLVAATAWTGSISFIPWGN
jgi:hypothetical protein